MTARALVVDSDPHRRRLACEALTMFQPGFKVSSASSLDAATAWLEASDPDLVLLDAEVAPEPELRAWWDTYGFAERRSIVFGSPPIEVGPHAAIVDASAGLPTLLDTVQTTMRKIESETRAGSDA